MCVCARCRLVDPTGRGWGIQFAVKFRELRARRVRCTTKIGAPFFSLAAVLSFQTQSIFDFCFQLFSSRFSIKDAERGGEFPDSQRDFSASLDAIRVVLLFLKFSGRSNVAFKCFYVPIW